MNFFSGDRSFRSAPGPLPAEVYPAPPPPPPEPSLVDVVSDRTALVDKNLAEMKERVEKLHNLGFYAVSLPLRNQVAAVEKVRTLLGPNISVIRPAMIHKFLAKVGEQRSGHGGRLTGEFTWSASWHISTYSTKTVTIQWQETPVPDYRGVPPDSVLNRLAEVKEKGVFDYFTIASVAVSETTKKIPDPLLLGRFHHVEDRFFLAQWGDDVSLDDLI